MKLFLLCLFISLNVFSQIRPEGFIIQIKDRSIEVLCPEKRKDLFSVIVENKSLTDQVAKFSAGNKILKYISLKSGKSESIEINNTTDELVILTPMSPAFQEIPLIFGKKSYEVPSKE